MRQKKRLPKSPKKEVVQGKPTLKQFLTYGKDYWKKYGHLTIFPNEKSYLAYVEGTYEQIAKLSDEDYAKYVELTRKTQLDYLKDLEAKINQKIASSKEVKNDKKSENPELPVT